VSDPRETETVRSRLLNLSQSLLECENPGEVAHLVTAAAGDVLEFAGAGVRLREGDRLPVAAMGGATSEGDPEDRPTVPVDGSPQGRAFREGDVVLDRIEPDDPYDREVFAESMYVGIGEYGVLCAGSEDGTFSERDVELAELLASMAETAFRRVDRHETLEHHSRVLETVEGMVWAQDADGHFTVVTDRLAAFLGYERERLLGGHVSVPLSADNVQRGEEMVRRLLADPDRESLTFEMEYRKRDGSVAPIEIELSLLTDDDGAYEGCVGVVQDITDRRERERYLQVLNRVLRHNLRNDLTVVLGLAEDLTESAGDETVATIARELRSVAADLVDLSEEARQIEGLLDRDPVDDATLDLGRVVVDLVDDAREAYPAASLSLSTSAAPTVRGDDRLTVALAQLIENAVQHNDGDPHVDVRVDRAADHATVAIADDGPGIPADEYAVVTGDRELSQLTHTSGLGLWLVRWAVDGCHGSVRFDEREGGGSVVSVRLPLADAG